MNEIEDGKLPPAIWLTDGNWYPDASHDPSAVMHIEVVSQAHADVMMGTPSKTVPGKTYTQYFAHLEGLKNVFEAAR